MVTYDNSHLAERTIGMAEMEKRPWRFTIEFDDEKAKRNGYNVDDLYDCVGKYAEQMGNVRIGLGTWQAKNRKVQFGAQCPVCATLSKQPWVMQNIKSWRTYLSKLSFVTLRLPRTSTTSKCPLATSS